MFPGKLWKLRGISGIFTFWDIRRPTRIKLAEIIDFIH
jgi:hypothetical protein